jgi:hypothetical protein
LEKEGADLKVIQIRSEGRGREEKECATYQAYLMEPEYTAHSALSVAQATKLLCDPRDDTLVKRQS